MRWFDPAGERTLWAGMCIYALLLFYGMVLILALLLRQRRHKMLAVAIPLTAVLYCLEQCIDIFTSGSIFSDTARKILRFAARRRDLTAADSGNRHRGAFHLRYQSS